MYRRRLAAEGVLNDELVASISRDSKAEAAAAVKFAEESPAPSISDIAADVYWETDNNTDASKIGHHFFA